MDRTILRNHAAASAVGGVSVAIALTGTNLTESVIMGLGVALFALALLDSNDLFSADQNSPRPWLIGFWGMLQIGLMALAIAVLKHHVAGSVFFFLFTIVFTTVFGTGYRRRRAKPM